MSTTVDDLIELKDQAVAACYGIVAAWENRNLAVIETAVQQAQDAVDRAELYDAAEEDEGAVSIEDHETLESECELGTCPYRDPDGKRGHKRRVCEGDYIEEDGS